MPRQDLGHLMNSVSTSMIVLTTSFVALRFFSRKVSKTGIGWDDWLALASLPFSLAISVSMYFAVAHGYGTPKGDTQYYYHVVFFGEFFWYTSFLLTKLSVLFFYNRVFGAAPGLKIALQVIGSITILWWIIIVFVTIFQCTPVSGMSVHVPGAVCIPAIPFFLGQSIPNIITDFAILLIPLPILWKLQMRVSKKTFLVIIFLVGYFVPIISIVRIVYYIRLGRRPGQHSAYDSALAATWSILEPASALIGACIPSLSFIVRRSFETTHDSLASLRSRFASIIRRSFKTAYDSLASFRSRSASSSWTSRTGGFFDRRGKKSSLSGDASIEKLQYSRSHAVWDQADGSQPTTVSKGTPNPHAKNPNGSDVGSVRGVGQILVRDDFSVDCERATGT